MSFSWPAFWLAQTVAPPLTPPWHECSPWKNLEVKNEVGTSQIPLVDSKCHSCLFVFPQQCLYVSIKFASRVVMRVVLLFVAGGEAKFLRLL